MNDGHGLILPSDTSSVCSEWESMRMKHPFMGEGLEDGEIKDIWESSASNYSDNWYRSIKDEILCHLSESGIVHGKASVIDIGCGPGTYSVPLSGMCRSILCVDSSKTMLKRIEDRCTSDRIGNIETLHMDCRNIPDSCRKDVSFTSLCPPMNNPGSMHDMERLGEKCVYISSANTKGSAETELWKRLGKDYSYAGYHTSYPYEYLRSIGRDPELIFFEQKNSYAYTNAEYVSKLTSIMRKYDVDVSLVSSLIHEMTDDRTEDGQVFEERITILGLLVWDPSSESRLINHGFPQAPVGI